MGFDKDKPDAYLDENEIQVENYSDLEIIQILQGHQMESMLLY